MLEIRDRMTLIVAMAIRLAPACEADRRLLARAGFTTEPETQAKYVVLLRFNPEHMTYDPWRWEQHSRTMREAHRYILQHFDELRDGAVVDVEYILGEALVPKMSEVVCDPPQQAASRTHANLRSDPDVGTFT